MAPIKTSALIQNLQQQVSGFKNQLSSIGNRVKTQLQNNISNWAQQNPNKTRAVLTYEPLVKAVTHPIQTAKASLKTQNIKTPQHFVSTVVRGTAQNLGRVANQSVVPYVKNLAVNPLKTASQLYVASGQPGISGLERAKRLGIAGLNTAYAGFNLTPAGLVWRAFEGGKAGSYAKLKGKPYKEQLMAAKKGLVGEIPYTGLGTATTTNESLATAFNIAEIALPLVYGGVQIWKSLKPNKNLATLIQSPENVSAEQNLMANFGFKSSDFNSKSTLWLKLVDFMKKGGHPDTGGNPEVFKNFMNSYQTVLKTRFENPEVLNAVKNTTSVTQPVKQAVGETTDALDTQINNTLSKINAQNNIKPPTPIIQPIATPLNTPSVEGGVNNNLSQNFTPPTPKMITDIAYQNTVKNGGVTINLKGIQPTEGYAYAPSKNTEVKIDETKFSTKDIDAFKTKNAELLSDPNNHLGFWKEDGIIYMDVSRVGPPTPETIMAAKAADQLAVFDLKNFKSIYTKDYETTNSPNISREQNIRAVVPGNTGGTQEIRPSGEKISTISTPNQEVTSSIINEGQIKIQQPQVVPVSPTPPQINFTPLNPQDPFYNIERMNIPAQEKQNIVDMFTKLKPEIEQVVGGTLSNEQVKEAAKFISDDLIKLVGQEKTEELAASQLSLRQKIAGLASDYSPEGTKALAQAIKRDKTFGEHIARILQARSINVDPSSPEGSLRKLYLQKILSVIDDEQKVIDAASKMTQEDWNNPQKTAEFYRDFIKPTVGEFIDKLRYSSMLSSPNTHLINVGSNLQGTGFLLPIQKTIEGSIDSFLSNISLGKRKRTRFAGEGLAYVKSYYSKETSKQASKKFYDIMRGLKEGNYPDINRDTALFPKPGTLHTIEKSFDFVLNSLFGEDGYFSIRTQAGLKSAYKYRASKGVSVDNLEGIIPLESKRALFNSPMFMKDEGIISSALGAGGKWVQGAAHSPSPLFRWLTKLSIPFVRIGTNLLKSGLEANPITGGINLIGNKDKIAGLAKILMGSGVMALAVIGMAKKSIELHAWSPADPTKRQAQYDAGILPWSIEVTLPGGQRESIQFSRLHPLIAFQLGMVAAVDQAWRENRLSADKGSAILEAVTGSMKFVADQSYFKNLGDMTNLIQGDLTSGSSLISNYPSQFVPFRAFQGWLTRIIDIYQHKPEEGASLLKQVIQNIQSGIPGLSQGVPQRLDTYGRPVENPQRFFNAVSPVRVSPIKSQEEEIFNLYMENAQLNEAIKNDELVMSKEKPGEVSIKAVDEKMSSKKQELLEKKARNEVELYHTPQAINGKYIYWDDEAGAIKTISSTLDSKELEKLSPVGQELAKQDAEYKYMTKLITSSGVDSNFIKKESERLGISVDDTTYDMLTRLEDTLQIEEIKNNINGLKGDQLLNELVAMRRVSDGSHDPLLTDTLIGKLVKEGIIGESLGDQLKTIGWDSKKKDWIIIPGTGKKPSFKKFSVPKAGASYKKLDLSFKNMTPTLPSIKNLKSRSRFKLPSIPTSSKTSSISLKIPKARVAKLRRFSVKK